MTDSPRGKRAVLLAGRILLGAVFIFAAVSKIAAPVEFARAVYLYHLLPDVLISAVAVFLPWLELYAACALLFAPKLRDASAALIAIMLLAFAVAIALNICRGLEAPCGCFAILGRIPAGWGHFSVDMVFAAIAIWLSTDALRERITTAPTGR
jgi:putative oxidoreductase